MTRETPVIDPGESKDFVYVGEQIPNQVLIRNLSATDQANFIIQGLGGEGRPGWSLFGILRPGETASILVSWPSEARITNQGVVDTRIEVGGDGIFPVGSAEAQRAGYR